MVDGASFLIAIAGGTIPALLWLWFWLREDKKHPEPKSLITLAFLAGMLAVPLVIFPQKIAEFFFAGTSLLILWAAIEELCKIGVAYGFLKSRAMNEPLDAVIYMVTVALGFSALENALFLVEPIAANVLSEAFVTGNFRFVGATLLHTLSSATIGIMIALSFYMREHIKRAYIATGIVLAITLHALFNFFILKSDGSTVLWVFVAVWVGVVIVIMIIEHIKHMRSPRSLAPPC